MQQKVKKLQEKPKINEVKKEAIKLVALMETQKEIFYQNYIHIQGQVKTNDQLVT